MLIQQFTSEYVLLIHHDWKSIAIERHFPTENLKQRNALVQDNHQNDRIISEKIDQHV